MSIDSFVHFFNTSVKLKKDWFLHADRNVQHSLFSEVLVRAYDINDNLFKIVFFIKKRIYLDQTNIYIINACAFKISSTVTQISHIGYENFLWGSILNRRAAVLHMNQLGTTVCPMILFLSFCRTPIT